MSVFGLAVLLVPAAVAWIAYAAAALIPGDRPRLVEALGWGAAVLSSLGVLPYVCFVGGLILFLPTTWLAPGGSVPASPSVAWVEALLLTAAVLFMARWSFQRFGSARFLTGAVVILGLGSVWAGRYLATADWFPAQS